jgi:chromodomain-helicase-DNA-binding protein 1
MSMTNGHALQADVDAARPPLQPSRSESDLSDLNDIPMTGASPTPAQGNEPASDDDAIHDMATSELDDDEDAPGEEDADFDAESPAHERANGMSHNRSSSESDSRPGKRKAEVDDEELMKLNPELYGLRRSVSRISAIGSIQPLTFSFRAAPDLAAEWYVQNQWERNGPLY